MNFSKALDQTLKHFGITGKSISAESGVSQQMISNFRRGQQRIYTDSLEKILSALPVEAQKYFYQLLVGQILQPCSPSVLDSLSQMDPVELAKLLNAIADQLVDQQKITA